MRISADPRGLEIQKRRDAHNCEMLDECIKIIVKTLGIAGRHSQISDGINNDSFNFLRANTLEKRHYHTVDLQFDWRRIIELKQTFFLRFGGIDSQVAEHSCDLCRV